MSDEIEPSEKLDIFRMFDLYKRYMDQENNLANQRINWLLVVQGVLLTGLFAVLTKNDAHLDQALVGHKAELLPSCIILFVMICICLIGTGFSWMSMGSINAALIAQRTLSTLWERNFMEIASGLHLPHIAGGGKKDNDKRGQFFAKHLPMWCVVMWLLFLALLTVTSLDLVYLYGPQSSWLHAIISKVLAVNSPVLQTTRRG